MRVPVAAGRSMLVGLAALLLMLAGPARAADAGLREIVFGSFVSPENAAAHAEKVGQTLGIAVHVRRADVDGQVFHRVVSDAMSADTIWPLTSRAAEARLEFWTQPAAAPADASIRSPRMAPGVDPPRRVAAAERGPPGWRLVSVSRTAALATTPAPTASPHPAPPVPKASLDQDSSAGSVRPARLPGRLDAELAGQWRSFRHRGRTGQDRQHPSAALRLEYSREWDDGRQQLRLDAFGRVDAEDSRRTHADLREAYYAWIGDDWEFYAGARRVFWGRTESKHLVDVINQVDLVEDVDEEDRLGQPMLGVTLIRDWGVVDAYLLLGFRERTFPGRDGRFTGPFVVDGKPRYDDGAGRDSIDWALRWSHFIGDLEIGVAHFSGVQREPGLEPLGLPVAGEPIRVQAVYKDMQQTSVDAQLILGDWAWKLEAFTRGGAGERFGSWVAGFERTLVGIGGTRADLGVLAEYLYDERDEQAPLLAFEHHWFAGLRLAANDLAGTQLLAGVIRDVHSDEMLLNLEASRRLGDRWTLELVARVFSGGEAAPAGDAAWLTDPDLLWGTFSREDYVQFELKRFL